MKISLQLSNDDAARIIDYARKNNLTMSELVTKCVLEHIEDEHDLQSFRAAQAEFQTDPTTYTLDEVERELGIIGS